MRFWLLKSEPSTWSWSNQVTDKTTMWDGVRNYQARNNLIAMKKNDKCFPKSVTLEQIKNEKKLSHIALVKQGRLSVMPIDNKSWICICKLGGLKP